MKLASTQYTLNKKAFEIYLSGCTIHCKGCHNPELQSFDVGEELTIARQYKLIDAIAESGDMIKEIWILGGEPLDNSDLNFYQFIDRLKTNFYMKKLVLFTGYDIKQIHSRIFYYFDEIKYGKYDEELRTEGELLASSNQKIWKRGD